LSRNGRPSSKPTGTDERRDSVAGLPHIRKIESTDLPAVTQLLEQLGYTILAQELAKRYEPVAEDRTHAVWVAV